MKQWVSAKIHGIKVTDKSVEYNGSVGVSRSLMEKVGMSPFEKVQIINLRNGQRWWTYLLPIEICEGQFTLNGGGARLGELGDSCVLITYKDSEIFQGAKVIFCDEKNNPHQAYEYTVEGKAYPCVL